MALRNSTAQGSSTGGENMYSLKWNHYHSYLTNGLAKLLDDEFSMTDITLACEGQFIEAHKVALAVCSPFFKEYFKTYRMDKTGGLIVLANVRFRDLKNLMQFIYHGEVNVSNSDLNSFLKTANDLKIEGLVDAKRGGDETNSTALSTTEQTIDRKAASTASSIVDSNATSRLPSTSSSNISSSGSGAPPLKRSRLSLSATTGHSISSPSAAQTCNTSSTSSSIPKSSEPSIPVVDTKQSTAPSVELSTISHYDPLEMEDEQEEEMISFDEVKTEPIAVYSLNEDDDDSLDHSGDNVSGTLRTESSGIVYHDYDSLSQPPGPGPSSSMSHHRTQSGSNIKSTNKSSVHKRSSNIGNVGKKQTRWGRCRMCPAKTVSRSRCLGCSQFICAKPTCRTLVVANKKSIRMCRNCVGTFSEVESVSAAL